MAMACLAPADIVITGGEPLNFSNSGTISVPNDLSQHWASHR
jgi:hypothetical protein